MKKIFLMALLMLMCGCQKQANRSQQKTYDYTDVADYFIEWSGILSQKEEEYMVYVFSYSCGHCKDIKQDILKAIIENERTIYLIEFSYEIPIVDNNSVYEGVDRYEDLGIIGTPTLFSISNKAVKDRYTGSKEIISTLYNN